MLPGDLLANLDLADEAEELGAISLNETTKAFVCFLLGGLLELHEGYGDLVLGLHHERWQLRAVPLIGGHPVVGLGYCPCRNTRAVHNQ